MFPIISPGNILLVQFLVLVDQFLFGIRARAGFGYGHQTVEDGVIKDGLWDVYNQVRAIPPSLPPISPSIPPLPPFPPLSLSLLPPLSRSLSLLPPLSLPPSLQFHMGMCGEDTAEKYSISREEQDQYARRSYENSQRATEDGTLAREIIPVTIPQKKGKPDLIVAQDEEFSRY